MRTVKWTCGPRQLLGGSSLRAATLSPLGSWLQSEASSREKWGHPSAPSPGSVSTQPDKSLYNLLPPVASTLSLNLLQATSGAKDLGRNADESRGAQPLIAAITFPLDAVSALPVQQVTWKRRVSARKRAQASWTPLH